MDAVQRQHLEDEIEHYDILIKASEDWSKQYAKDPDTHARLIKNEAKFQRAIAKLFRDKSKEVESYINWSAFYGLIKADVTVDVVVDDSYYDNIDDDFLKISFEFVASAVTIGAQAGEAIYDIPLGIQSTDAIIQELTTHKVAALVGKKVDKSGQIVDNPKPEYRISDKTRNDINKSILRSIATGEDKKATIDRLRKVVDSPARAENIAQTESVNAYANGLLEFGQQSNATGKEVQTVGAVDICAENAALGVVPLDHDYDGYQGPAFHNRCRCGLRLAYANEFGTNQ